jgi:hypothetical protein
LYGSKLRVDRRGEGSRLCFRRLFFGKEAELVARFDFCSWRGFWEEWR